MASVVLPASVILEAVAKATERMRPPPNVFMIGSSLDDHNLQQMKVAAELALRHHPHLIALDDQELRLIEQELGLHS